ncbi:MAG: DUF3857 domain-containing protein [Chitinophagaceae bacterium]
MKKNIYLLIAVLVFNLSATAQKNVPAFGEADPTELSLQSCPFERDANAMKILDIQETEYEPSAFGGKIRTMKRVRIKIFNEKGFNSATITIPYYSNKKNTKIEDLKGIVFNMDASGKIVTQKVEEEDFFKDKAMEKVGVIRFTFPNLHPGSIIEYTYTISEKNRLYLDPWIIQAEIPTAYASAAVIIPTFSGIRETVFGNDSVEKKTEKLTKGLDKEKKIFYKMNIPAFKPEPHMSSWNDNLLRMGFLFFPESGDFASNFSAASLWKIPANMLLKSSIFDEQFKKVIPGTEKIIDTAMSITYTEDRIRYIFNTVKKRFPEKMGQTGSPDEIDNVWKTRSGTSAQVNMVLMNFLQRSNIKFHPLLVSTREHGKIKIDFPNFGQFNGLDVLAVDKGTYYLLDANLRYQPYNIPPLNILNREAFLLDPDNIQWIKITDDRPLLKQETDIFSVLTKEGILEGSATIKFHDYAKSLALDSSLADMDSKDNKFFDKKIPGLKMLSNKQENADTDEPLLQSIEFDYEPQQSGDFYFINPQLLSSKKINPFSQAKRNTDIDFGCNQEYRLTMQLEVPETFQVDNLPQNMIIRSPDSSFVFTRIVSFDHSNISYAQTLEIKKAIFEKEKYAGLYDFFSRVDGLLAEEIVLKKKK